MTDRKYTEGSDALWTTEQKAAWCDQYTGTFLAGNAASSFEFEMSLFANGNMYVVPKYVLWVREIALEVSSGAVEFPKSLPKSTPSWRAYRDEAVAKVVADLQDAEQHDSDPFLNEDTRAALWVYTLTPYRVYSVMLACLDAAERGIEATLHEMAVGADRGRLTQGLVREEMVRQVKAIRAEFEAYEEARV